MIQDRMLVSGTAGETVRVDFSDILAPKKEARTLRYRQVCCSVFRDAVVRVAALPPGAKRDEGFKLIGKAIRDVPVRGADEEAVEKWTSFAREADELASSRVGAFGVEYFLETIARGLNGDPGGATAERLKTMDAGFRGIENSFRDVEDLAAKLTLRYDKEFKAL